MQTSSNVSKGVPGARLAVVAVALLAGAVGVRWLLGTAAGPAVRAARGSPVPPAEALLAAVALAAAVVGAWLVLGLAVELLARLPGSVGRASGRLSARMTPLLLRRALGLALGVGVGVGLGAGPSLGAPAPGVAGTTHAWVCAPVPAAAGGGPQGATDTGRPAPVQPGPPSDGLPDPGWSPAPDPGWTPTAPVVRPQPDVSTVSAAGRRTTAPEHGEVVVRRGDSLWAIAARHLGRGVTDAEIAAEWPRWYAANRAVIGADPDLLLPGQVLRPPDAPEGHR